MRLRSWIGAAIAVILAGAQPVPALAGPCPQVEVAPVASDGASATVVRDGNGEEVPLRPSLVTRADITSASVSHADGQDGIGFGVSPAAGRRLRDFTATNVGEKLAFVIEGKAQMVVKVLDPTQGDAFWISPYAKADAEALATRVNSCVGNR